MKWFLVPTGRALIDPGGAFGIVPRPLWERYYPPDENYLIPMDIHSLLVQSEEKWILVDTGLGDKLDDAALKHWHLEYPHGSLLENMGRLGLKAADIDMVINTHLHTDHCGGNTLYEREQLVPAFPNAQYIVQHSEYEDACQPNERTRATYFMENFEPLKKAGKLQLIDGAFAVTDQVHCIPSPGHSPGHQCVILQDAAENVLFVADLATYSVQFDRLAWVTAFDIEPLQSMETKRTWHRWALEKDALLAFQHDPFTPLGRLEETQPGKFGIAKVKEHEGLRLIISRS